MLPAVIEEHGVGLVRLMLASYAISDAPVPRRDAGAARDRRDVSRCPTSPRTCPTTAEELPNFGLVAREPAKKGKADPTGRAPRAAQGSQGRTAAPPPERERAGQAAGQASRREKLHAAKRPPTPK